MAGPLKAIENGYFRAFNFSGRASRSEFWWFQLFTLLVTGVLFLDLAQGGLLIVWFYLLNIIPNLSLIVRRLHDTNRSGFWFFISFLPAGQFVLLYFYILPSYPDQNHWGGPEDGPKIYRNRFSGSNAQSGYAALMQVPPVNSAQREDFEAARRAEIQEYYRTRVLGQRS
ncbi:DUF805 domain-containing protein [Celeribacter neptunius]|uniref:Uncharacterized membrane protein YhaH, DUF805 family n=1 Tax=Celeribacter neptunius TaxID=588602 RepID=A0A1I3UIV1_9RHOB|nr:DUF805 domain-containing protein [Celeribacter neptunius]SFJ82852.1 Uncharacterized membrane protein YhaH, DUF805 family [Celeribacter neptunius]